MDAVQEALARISGKRIAKDDGKKLKRLSPCCRKPLTRRTVGLRCYVCSQCGYACGTEKWQQLQIDMK